MGSDYSTARHGLISFLTLLDSDCIDTCVKNGQPIHSLDDCLVQQRVISAIKKLDESICFYQRSLG